MEFENGLDSEFFGLLTCHEAHVRESPLFTEMDLAHKFKPSYMIFPPKMMLNPPQKYNLAH